MHILSQTANGKGTLTNKPAQRQTEKEGRGFSADGHQAMVSTNRKVKDKQKADEQ